VAGRSQQLVSPPNLGGAPLATSTPHAVSSGAADLSLLLVRIIVLLVASRVVGAIVRQFGQPQVVGEMLGFELDTKSIRERGQPAVIAAVRPARRLSAGLAARS
jgi:hypothetical protein